MDLYRKRKWIKMTKKKCIVCGKEFIGRNNSRYFWHTQGKIINEDKIVYVTNMPEFHGELKQYIAFVTVNNNIHNIMAITFPISILLFQYIQDSHRNGGIVFATVSYLFLPFYLNSCYIETPTLSFFLCILF